MDALGGELRAVTGVEVGRESTNGGGLGGLGDVVFVIDVSADKVEKLLSSEVTERVGLGLMDLPRDSFLELLNDIVSDGVSLC